MAETSHVKVLQPTVLASGAIYPAILAQVSPYDGTFTADVCDFGDGTSSMPINDLGTIFIGEGALTYDFGNDESFVCDGTGCK